jgi:hypothetical protein
MGGPETFLTICNSSLRWLVLKRDPAGKSLIRLSVVPCSMLQSGGNEQGPNALNQLDLGDASQLLLDQLR